MKLHLKPNKTKVTAEDSCFFLKKAEKIEMLRAFDHIYGITGRLELILEFLDVFYW